MSSDAGSVSWAKRSEFERHYRKHRQEMGARTREAYLGSARQTIRLGTRFTYFWNGRTHVGYFHRQTRRLTTLMEDEGAILTHYRTSERQVRRFPDSTYN